jgi:uncharacterized Zn finger protein
MCKHVAGALYGIGARLDTEPRLLFELRGVDESELVAGADQVGGRLKSAPRSAKVLADDDVAALFGLEMTESVGSTSAVPAAASAPRSTQSTRTTGPKPKKAKSKLEIDLLRNTRMLAKEMKAIRQRRARRKRVRRAKKRGG